MWFDGTGGSCETTISVRSRPTANDSPSRPSNRQTGAPPTTPSVVEEAPQSEAASNRRFGRRSGPAARVRLVSVAVWIEARRPIFYGGEREGLRGRVFKCWKFRTMRMGPMGYSIS